MKKEFQKHYFRNEIIVVNLILFLIIVILIIKGINHISTVYVIDTYRNNTSDQLGGTELILQSNNTFIYQTWLDIEPNYVLRGKWEKTNDTIILNGHKCFKELDFLKDTICYTFMNAKFKMYPDSLVLC